MLSSNIFKEIFVSLDYCGNIQVACFHARIFHLWTDFTKVFSLSVYFELETVRKKLKYFLFVALY